MIIPKYALTVITKIEDAGFEAFAVGGCVRDSILGKIPSDWDIATSATPTEILDVFSDFTTIPTGFKHGTITVLSCGIPVEVTTYRIDGKYADNRHPESVTFSRVLADDLSRRDFTVNAMAYNPKLGLLDLFCGCNDLHNKILRCVGKPEKRFTEDALRIMRALRFSAVLGFEIEPQSAKAIKSCAHLLKSIAAERIRVEFSKLLLAENPKFILSQYKDIFLQILGIEAPVTDELWLQHCEAVSAAEPILALRLSLLLYGLPLARSLQLLKYDNVTKHTAETITAELNTVFSADKIPLKKALSVLGKENLELILKAKIALGQDKYFIEYIRKTILEILNNGECFSIKQLNINGYDLQNEIGIAGREIGIALEKLLDAVICGKCKNKKPELLDFLKKTR